jgi:hypothetical protein
MAYKESPFVLRFNLWTWVRWVAAGLLNKFASRKLWCLVSLSLPEPPCGRIQKHLYFPSSLPVSLVWSLFSSWILRNAHENNSPWVLTVENGLSMDNSCQVKVSITRWKILGSCFPSWSILNMLNILLFSSGASHHSQNLKLIEFNFPCCFCLNAQRSIFRFL